MLVCGRTNGSEQSAARASVTDAEATVSSKEKRYHMEPHKIFHQYYTHPSQHAHIQPNYETY